MLLLDCVELSQACEAHSVSLFRETFVPPVGDSTRAFSSPERRIFRYVWLRMTDAARISSWFVSSCQLKEPPRNGVLSLYVLYSSACHPFYSVTPPTTYMKQLDFTYPLVLPKMYSYWGAQRRWSSHGILSGFLRTNNTTQKYWMNAHTQD